MTELLQGVLPSVKEEVARVNEGVEEKMGEMSKALSTVQGEMNKALSSVKEELLSVKGRVARVEKGTTSQGSEAGSGPPSITMHGGFQGT